MRFGVLALLLLAPGLARAGAGTTPFEFLSLDANARPVALGGAYTALAADSNALLYNPGGLGLVERHEATFMHNRYFEGVSQQYASFAARSGWGAQINYLDFGSIQKTTIANKDGTGLSSYGISDLALSGGYGRRVAPGLGAGVALKYIRETIETVSASGLAFDAGALYRPERLPGLGLGVALRNLGPEVKFQREGQQLPLQLRLGAAYAFRLLGQANTVAVDVLKKRGEDLDAALGLESVVVDRLAIRLGYDSRNDAGPGIAAGFGWTQGGFDVDYAFVPFGDLGSAHRLSATLRWGPSRSGAEPRSSGEEPSAPDRNEPPAQRSPQPSPSSSAPKPPPPPAGGAVAAIPELPRHLWLTHHLANARALLEKGQAEQAETHLRMAAGLLEEQPGRKVGYEALLGRAAQLRGDAVRARFHLLEALREAEASGATGPEVADAHAWLADILIGEKRPEEAARHLRRGLDAHPADAARERMSALLKRLEAAPRAAPSEGWE